MLVAALCIRKATHVQTDSRRKGISGEGFTRLYEDYSVSAAKLSSSQPNEETQASNRTMAVTTHVEMLDGYRTIAIMLFAGSLAYELIRMGAELEGYAYEGTLATTILPSLQIPSVFFVLTGFLGFLPFVKVAMEQQDGVSPWYLLSRRLVLILPQYYLVVTAIWIWRFEPELDHWYDLLHHLTLTHIFNEDYLLWPIGPSWIVATELWFYVLLALVGPTLVGLCQRLSYANRRSLLVATSLLLLFTGVAYKWWAYSIAEFSSANYLVYLNPIAHVDSLAFGMMLAIILVNTHDKSLFGTDISIFLRVISFTSIAALISLRRLYPTVDLYFHTLFAAAFVLLVASTVFGLRGSWLESAVRWRPLQWLAAVSYAVLLLYEPLLSEMATQRFLISSSGGQLFFGALVVLIVSVLLGAVIYRLFVYPALQALYRITLKGNRAGRHPPEHTG